MKTVSHTKFVVQLDGFINLVYLTLDEAANGRVLAANAYLSRFHFQRLFARTLGEAPVAFRRRLLLERAAYRISSTGETITEIVERMGVTGLGYGNPIEWERQAEPATH